MTPLERDVLIVVGLFALLWGASRAYGQPADAIPAYDRAEFRHWTDADGRLAR